MSVPRVLVVASDSVTTDSVHSLLARHSFDPEAIASGATAIARMRCEPLPDVVLMQLANGNGEDVATLQRCLEMRPELKVIVFADASERRQVIEAIRIGAYDYINAPVSEPELLDMLHRYVTDANNDPAHSHEKFEDVGGGHFFVSASPVMEKVRLQAQLLANIDVPVLILGESGTGKEAAAHLIHKLSARPDRPLLKVNCAALPGELLESELFGYERGAFTGTTRTKPGKFELCEQGTILLDEVAELSANLQAKLLQVLQDRQFFRLGGESAIEVNVRILATTNVNVQQAIADRCFREDLYYRLSAFTIYLPPLRERPEEIPILLQEFMRRTAAQYSRAPMTFSKGLMDACLGYAWPGNLRELQNFVKRYLVMADENAAFRELRGNDWHRSVVADSLPVNLVQDPGAVPVRGSSRNLKSLVRNLKDETEIEAITKALAETDWNRKRAARLLHISYRSLLYKIHQHGITRVSVSQIRPLAHQR